MNKNRWVADNYGSRRGMVRTFWYRLLYRLGRYRGDRQVDWTSVERLVFVCKGNICRSAYAEAVARKLGFEAISCGLDTIEDAPANADAISSAKRLGYNLERHITQPVMYLIVRKTDLLITMEPWQSEFLNKHLTRGHYCTLLGLWGKPVLPHIQDPYGATTTYFDNCFSYIEESVHALTEKIR